MLAPIVVDAIDETFEAVRAPATVVMTDRPNARAGIIHEVPERVGLCRRCGQIASARSVGAS
jgi:hypothetical protein